VLQTIIAGHHLPVCLYNASGAMCTTKSDLGLLADSYAGAVLTKSCTLAYRNGNPKPRYHETPIGSINSMGIPNLGYEVYAQTALEHHSKYPQKPYFVSVSGMSINENLDILAHLNQTEQIAAIELNLSCPNLPGKPQVAYDFPQTERMLDAVFDVYQKPLGIKLPPYFDLVHFEQIATILNQYPLHFVTCVNSIGNGLVIDWQTETSVIKPKGGLGGIGGDYIKPTALANVRIFSQLLRPSIAVIGCGGVKSGSDAFEHILCGASAVQIGTQLMKEGTDCFERIATELQQIMHQKGYTNINDFKGKLKTIE
jgi:dihydroorotate dehydrogenase (fumarate)